MRAARVFRWILRIFVLFLTATMTIVSVLGGLSAVNILNDPNNIEIPSGPLVSNIGNTTNPDEWYISVPFELTNAGYYDLTDLKVGFDITMDNATRPNQTIYSEVKYFGNILHGETLNDAYNASNFIISDIYYNPRFWVNISMSAQYSLNLIYFEVELNNIDISSF